MNAPKKTPAVAAWDSRIPAGISVETGVPGAVVELVERPDGVIEELNGAGSIVALIYPYGVGGMDFSGECDWWGE